MFKVTIRVVETMVQHTTFPNMQALSEWIAEKMLDESGGATVNAPSMGMWKDESGNVIKEMGQDVWTLTEHPVKLLPLASLLKVIGQQDCVLFTAENLHNGVNFV